VGHHFSTIHLLSFILKLVKCIIGIPCHFHFPPLERTFVPCQRPFPATRHVTLLREGHTPLHPDRVVIIHPCMVVLLSDPDDDGAPLQAPDYLCFPFLNSKIKIRPFIPGTRLPRSIIYILALICIFHLIILPFLPFILSSEHSPLAFCTLYEIINMYHFGRLLTKFFTYLFSSKKY
jgi:hypothetical protein